MVQSHRISVLAPLGVSVIALVCTIAIYLVPLRATVNLVRRERRRGHVGTPWTDLGIFARVVFYASLAHLLD
jgi:predicted ATPase